MKSKLLRQLVMLSRHVIFGLFVQSVLSCMLIAADTRAQVKEKSIEDIFITLDLDNVRLDDAFEQISSTTGFTFAYNERLVNLRQRINIHVQRESLAKVLLSISEKSNLKFKRINEYIHVGKRATSEDIKVEEKIIEQATTITGRVTSEEDGEGIPGVNVIVKRHHAGDGHRSGWAVQH